MSPTVYAYSEPRQYLRDVLAQKQNQNPLFSLRSWARMMGFRCHTSLVFLMNGKRKIRPDHLERLNRGLKLQGDERKYLDTLVRYHCAKTPTEKAEYEANLKLLAPTREQLLLDMEKFKTVSDWIHMTILEMTKLKGFKSDPEWIAARLCFGVTVHAVTDAIDRLLKLGLLTQSEGILKSTNARVTTPQDRASESIRAHHKQVLQNASRAVEEQDVAERILNSCTMTVDASRINEAKDLILKFRTDMAKLMEKNDGDETYQLSVQFFKLTENPAKKQTENP